MDINCRMPFWAYKVSLSIFFDSLVEPPPLLQERAESCMDHHVSVRGRLWQVGWPLGLNDGVVELPHVRKVESRQPRGTKSR